MAIFLVVLLVLGVALEIYSLYDGLKHVDFDYEPSVRCAEPGEEFLLTTTVSNTGRLPISYIRTESSVPVSVKLPEGVEYTEDRFCNRAKDIYRIWGKKKISRTMKISAEKRGIHIFDGAELVRGDFLGVSEARRNYEKHNEVLIYPKRLDSDTLNEALGNYCGDMVAQRWLIRDPIITMGVREYTGREPMKTISWTQSARRGELMVREFDYTRELSCAVILVTNGLGPLEHDLLDKCCSITRTICENLVEKNINLTLHTNAPLWGYRSSSVWSCNVEPGKTADMLETLARVYASSRCTAEELAGTVSRASGTGTAYIVVAPYANDAVKACTESLREASGMNVMLIAASEWEV